MDAAIHTDIAGTIGNTPVLRLTDALVPAGSELLLKMESFNPTASVKDRTALGLVQDAMSRGLLKRGGTLIESTSGNLGKSLAMLGAVYGFHVVVIVDPNVDSSTLNWYRAYGARVERVTERDEHGGYQMSRLRRLEELRNAQPDAYWPDQYANPVNPTFHARTTASELAPLRCQAVLGGIGTGGHLSGVGSALKRIDPHVSLVACDNVNSGIFGEHYRPYLTRGVGLVARARNTDLKALDYLLLMSDQEAISMCRLLAREHGILVGGSAGLVIAAAICWLAQHSRQRVVAIVPDAGQNYLAQLYDDQWLAEQSVEILPRDSLLDSLRAKQSRSLASTQEVTGGG